MSAMSCASELQIDSTTYVCHTLSEGTSSVLVHQVAVATALFRHLPYIAVLPLLHWSSAQCWSHILATSPIILHGCMHLDTASRETM